MRRIQPLTKRQKQIYEFIASSIRLHGYAPSLEEIGDELGLSSLATVHKHLQNLVDRGYILRSWNRARSITLIVGDGCCPMCGSLLEKKSVDEAKVSIDFGRKVSEDKAVELGTPIPPST